MLCGVLNGENIQLQRLQRVEKQEAIQWHCYTE